MRLTSMSRFFVAALLLSPGLAFPGVRASAQISVPPNQATPFKDTSMLKPPAGAKVAVVEWEDLECPACAKAFPIVHQAIAHYHIPLVRHDFQIPGHIWSHEAAIYARYMQDKINLDLSTDYRRQVFASQFRIASKDDLKAFTQQFLSSKGQQMPFVLDPSGQFAKEVDADTALGDKLGLRETPTIVVVTPKGWIQVKDVMQLYSAIDMANAEVAKMPAEKAAPVKKTTTAHK